MRKVDGRLTGLLAELALEASSNGVVITDALRKDNPIIYVNPAFERIIGYAAGEAVGRNCRFLRDLNEEQPGPDGLRAALREGWGRPGRGSNPEHVELKRTIIRNLQPLTNTAPKRILSEYSE